MRVSSFPFNTFRSFAENFVPARAKDSVRQFLANRLAGRVVTYHNLKSRAHVDSWQFDTERSITFTEPTYSNRTPDEISRILGEHVVHQPYVLEVPDVTLTGQQGIKRTAAGEFLVYNYDRPASAEARSTLAYDIVDSLSMGVWPFRTGPTHTQERIDLAVPLTNRWATNYAHWAEECLTQVQGLREYERQTGRHPTILIPPDPPSFVLESLDHLGYDQGDYRELSAERYHVERMVLPSVRLFWSGTSEDYIRDPGAIRWLQREMFDAMDEDLVTESETPSKLLVSREQDADTRRITNWDAVESALSKQGFETVVLGELEYSKQKRLFRRADIVVATHGAGLSNLIYAEETAVVELFGSHFVPPYYEISQELGHRYSCLYCEPRGDDLRVDIELLQTAIEATTTS